MSSPKFVVDEAAIKTAEVIFRELTELHSLEAGKDISAQEREDRGIPEDALCSLVYGEAPFQSLAVILQKVKHLLGISSYAKAKYVDLGSGTGKTVMAAALLHTWRECCGIELVEGLYDSSLELLERWHDGLPYMPKGQKKIQYKLSPEVRATPINLLQGDVLEVDWSDADVVFSCSTCFEDDLMAQISKRAEKLKPGSIVVTCGQRLQSDAFGVIDESDMVMSWGPSRVYIQQRAACE